MDWTYRILLGPVYFLIPSMARHKYDDSSADLAADIVESAQQLVRLEIALAKQEAKELAIRGALGATRWRLVRQMLTESLVLSCCGAALGLLLAFVGTRALAHLTSVSIPLLSDVRIDAGALGFTLVAALATGLLFGLVPALQVQDLKLHDVLKDSNRGSSQGRGHASPEPRLDLKAAVSEEASAYMIEHRLPEHPLRGRRFLSIGCVPCTRAVAEGEDERAGRWAGSGKTECGLHTHLTPAAR